MKNIVKFLSVGILSLSLISCAALAPKQQTNTFNPQPAFSTQAAAVSGPDYSDDISKVNKTLKSTQESFQAQQNGLIGLNGRLTGIEANVQANTEIQASAIRSLNATADIQANAIKNLNSNITAQAEIITSIGLTINNSANIVSNMENKFAALQNSIETKITSTAGRDNNSTIRTVYNSTVGYVVLLLAVFVLIGFMWQKREIKLLKQSLNNQQVQILPLGDKQ